MAHIENRRQRRFAGPVGSIGIVILVSVGCGSADANLHEVFGTKQVLEAVKSAERVEACRLAPESYHKASLAEYDFIGDPVRVSEADADALVAVLVDPATYLFDMAKGCLPVYGVGVRFIAGAEEVTVLFCFECDILTVYRGDQEVGGEDFDPARARFVAIMQRIFPKDEAIQALE